jgi:hypothetical protein
MENLKIKSDEKGITKIYLGEKEITGVREIKFKHKAGGLPIANINLYIDDYDVTFDYMYVKKEPFFKKIAHKIRTKFV